MAFDPGPCGPQFEDWEAAHAAWKSKKGTASKSVRRAGAGTVVAGGVCVAAWWTGIGLIACGAAGATALYFDGESINDTHTWGQSIDAVNAAQKAYEDCVYNHKKYYGKDRITNPI